MHIVLRTIAVCAALLVDFGSHSAASDWPASETGLPNCRRSGEDRVPIAMWWGYISERFDRATPVPPPPMPGGTITYLSLEISQNLLDDPDTLCTTLGEERTFTLKFPNDAKRPESGGMRIHLRGEAGFHLGSCTVSGFYISAPASNIREGWSDIWLRDVEGRIGFYPHYCVVNDKHRPKPAKPRVLPACIGASDIRTPVSVWRPQLTAGGELTSAPPQGDGMIVSIAIDTKRDANRLCAGWDHGHFGFLLPKGASAVTPDGLLVSLLGNETVLPGKCRLFGFYMNEPVFDRSSGLSRTSFSSVNADRLIASGQFCRGPEIPKNGMPAVGKR
jgi:hypothetical protein